MGGNGSGKWSRLNKKTIADRCYSMDINEISKASKLEHDYAGVITWTTYLGHEYRIRVKVIPMAVELEYEVGRGANPKFMKYIVRLTFTPCNFGNQRPWFSCPGCAKRVSKLYLKDEYFLCRHCHNLAYACQSEDLVDRLMRKAKKIRERLGCPRNLREPILFKPKGMHQKSFDRLWLPEMIIMRQFNRGAIAALDLLEVRSAEAISILNRLKKAQE